MAAERLAFQSILFTFGRHMPLRSEPDLVRHWEYLYEHSVGCVGVLKEWLGRALERALAEESTTLKRAHLEASAIPTRKLLRLAREIRHGEEWMAESQHAQEELRTLLGLEGQTPPAPASPPSKKRPASGRVGQRQPIRDVIGNESDAPR